MGIEAPVFHGDEGGGQIAGHLVQGQPLAHHRAAMADIVAFRIQEGESQRPVDGIKVDIGIQPGREQAQHQRREIKQRQWHRDHRHGDGESRGIGLRRASLRQSRPSRIRGEPTWARLLTDICGGFKVRSPM